jgi:Ni,Fe-hydrogenase III large subunit
MNVTSGGRPSRPEEERTNRTVEGLWQDLKERLAAGERFAGLNVTADNSKTLSAYVARPGGIDILTAGLPAGATGYPALTPLVGAAFWYERVIRDQTGLVPEGHPRLAPLVAPGSPQDYALPRHVDGYGVFTFPHGPVRSGVFESMEYLVETPGEAIPHLNMRVFYKHRGIAERFTGAAVPDGVLLAERAEGIASVAHALAFCHAIETIAGLDIPRGAALLRVIHAELERIANHLDVAMRLSDAAGLAVATARFALHKERVMRLVSGLCGSRFGRGVVVPGGVAGPLLTPPADLAAAAGKLERAVAGDAESFMATSSMLDRLRGTGPLTPKRSREHGALGPVGKGSGYNDDARVARPYDAYDLLASGGNDPPHTPPAHGGTTRPPVPPAGAGDALSRLRVRWDEVAEAFRLVRVAAGELSEIRGAPPGQAESGIAERPLASPSLPAPVPDGLVVPDGRAVGWAEAPQGEVLYDVTVAGGRIARCQPRSASFHNLVLMHEVFQGDILTDFPFIEASFGLSVAGVVL